MPAHRFYLRLSGMTAVHAVRALNTALGGLPGVTHVDVRMGEAVIAHDGRLTEAMLREAVAQSGLTILNLSEDRRRRLPLLE
jgi:copper chaperone CopZ